MTSSRTNGRRLLRRAGAGLGVAAAGGALLVAASTAVSSGQDATPEAVTQLQREIAAMRAGGMPADHPKVELLQDEVDALVEGIDAHPPPDPGLDAGGAGASGGSESDGSESGAQAVTPEDAARTAEEAGAGGGAEAAEVECEPVPHALTADDVADAVCASVPQPDGTSRFVAVLPTGAVHAVRFDGEGRAERMPDQAMPVGAASAASSDAEVTLVPEESGDLRVMSGDEELATLDVR